LKNSESNLKSFKKLENLNNNLKGNFAKKALIHIIFRIVVVIKNFYIWKLKIINLKFNLDNY